MHAHMYIASVWFECWPLNGEGSESREGGNGGRRDGFQLQSYRLSGSEMIYYSYYICTT